jgi:hypothetical protein
MGRRIRIWSRGTVREGRREKEEKREKEKEKR